MQLAEKTSGASVSSSKLRDLDDKLAKATLEIEELRAQKLVFEKRCEALKGTTRTSREEMATLQCQIDMLSQRASLLEEDLELEREKVVKAEAVAAAALAAPEKESSSEIRVLEEENIELMKENKELRNKVLQTQAQADRLQSQLSRASSTTSTLTESRRSATSATAAEMPAAAPSRSKARTSVESADAAARSFGTDISLTASAADNAGRGNVSCSWSSDTVSKAGAGDAALPLKSRRRGAGGDDTIKAGLEADHVGDTENAAPVPADETMASKRSRTRTKVSASSAAASTAAASISSADTGAECAQS